MNNLSIDSKINIFSKLQENQLPALKFKKSEIVDDYGAGGTHNEVISLGKNVSIYSENRGYNGRIVEKNIETIEDFLLELNKHAFVGLGVFTEDMILDFGYVSTGLGDFTSQAQSFQSLSI